MSQQPIVPPNHQITVEAAEALNLELPQDMQEGYGAGADNDGGISEGYSFGDMSDGSVIDAEIVDEPNENTEKPASRARRTRVASTPKTGGQREAKAGPPSLDEWTGFFSRVVLRVTTEWYISYAFRGIDEDVLSEREIERLAMTDEERQMIAVPFAEISHKSKFMRKHGRMIVASGDAFNAMVVIGSWASRVNRIASRHRPRVVKGQSVNGSNGQSEGSPSQTEGATGGHFPEWFSGPIVPGSG